jgi:hypothetical protein
MPFDFGGNLNRYLRMAQLFGEPQQDTPDMGGSIDFSQINTDEQDDFNPISRMRQLYQPDTRMSDRFNTLMDQFPHRDDYQPGALRKIAAIAASFGRPEGVEQALYSPYHRKLSDWKEEIGPVSRAAEIERNANVNQRMVASNILSNEMAGRRLERQLGRDRTLEEQGNRRLTDAERNAQTKADQAAQRIKQADERLKIANKLAKGGVLNVDDAGNARIVYKDGSTEPVDGSYLSFEEKEQAKAKTRAATGRQPKTDIVRDPRDPNKNILVKINDDGTWTEIKEKGTGEKAEPVARATPAGEARTTLSKAQEVKNSNPKWNKWIKIDKGQVTITRPGILTGPKQEEYDKIYQAIFGSPNQEKPPTRLGGPGPGNNVVKTPLPPGKVKVRLPDGRTGTMDRKELSQLPPGSQVLEQ